jgi:hypothetical protein
MPPPVVGKSANVSVVSGVVYFRPPGSRSRGFGAAGGFRRLTADRQVPMGSTLDTTRGVMEVQTAVGTSQPGKTQTGQFKAGSFLVRQVGGRRRPTTEMVLNGQLKCRSTGRGRLQAAARSSRRLWGNGKGRFRTRGRHSSATVRGTSWLTKDSCNATTTSVRRGTVVVRDFGKKKNVTVKAGRRYVARPRKR